MRFPIAIKPGDERAAWGVVVPDLPGCFSAADSGIDEAIKNAKEAIELWIETANQWEATYSHATDIESGMPVYVEDRGMYMEKVQLYLKEMNNATNKD